MSSDLNDCNKTIHESSPIESSQSSICKKIWACIYVVIELITFIVACFQLTCCILFLLITITAAMGVVCRVQSITKYLDDFTGVGISSGINRDTDIRFFLIMLALIVFASFPVYISAKLCNGLSRKIERHIWSYIMCGLIFMGIRLWLWAVYNAEHHYFPFDKNTVIFYGPYTLFLCLLVINCFEIRRNAKNSTTSLKISSFFATLRSNHGTTIMYGPV